MLVEILVLGRDERGLDAVGDRLDRQVEAPLVGILGDQLAIGGMNAGHHRRLVFGEHVVIRQVGREAGNVPGSDSSSGKKQHGTDPE